MIQSKKSILLNFKYLYNSNIVYFFWFSLFLFIGGFLLYKIPFGSEFLFFNPIKYDFFNYFFRFFTLLGEAYIFIIIFFYLLFKKSPYTYLIPIIGGLVSLLVWITKKTFVQFRPLEYIDEYDWMNQIKLVPNVYMNSGDTTMPSGHTLSAFAIFTILAFIIKNNKAFWNTLLFFCALFVGISRVYLVQHFLKDIYTGAFFGVLLATFVYLCFDFFFIDIGGKNKNKLV